MQKPKEADLSAKFEIFETEQFAKDLEETLKAHKEKFLLKLQNQVYPQLRENPYFGKNIRKLRDYKPETWRYRISDYRFFYEIDDKAHIVFMISADNRKDSY